MFLWSVTKQEAAVAADGVEVFDLSVNPLSVICIGIRPLNETSTLTAFQRAKGLADSLNSIRVLHRGASVFNMSGGDALMMNYFRHGMLPFEANGDDTDNERRCMLLPIILGRHPFDPDSCFPATVRGELTMELDIDVADTGYDGFRYSIESLELLDANPSHFERKVTLSKTFNATGLQDFPLPTGNLVRGLLLFGTTPFGGATPAPSWGRMRTMLDNQEIGYTSSDFEMAHQMGQLFGRQPPTGQAHNHRVDATGGATQLVGNPCQEGLTDSWNQYAFLDFDPTRDDTHAVNTAGSSNWIVRADVETADACRVVQIERINL